MKFHQPYYPRTFVANLILNNIASSPFIPRHLRTAILRLWGAEVKTTRISHGCKVGGKKLKIGEDVFVNGGVRFDTNDWITIGRNTFIGQEVAFITSTHELGAAERRAGPCIARPIAIGSGCWIGARVIILPGVTVGDGSVIAAGSVVVRNCERDCLYAGNPATMKKRLD